MKKEKVSLKKLEKLVQDEEEFPFRIGVSLQEIKKNYHHMLMGYGDIASLVVDIGMSRSRGLKYLESAQLFGEEELEYIAHNGIAKHFLSLSRLPESERKNLLENGRVDLKGEIITSEDMAKLRPRAFSAIVNKAFG